MKVKEFTVSAGISGVISEAPFENFKPFWNSSITIEDETLFLEDAKKLQIQLHDDLYNGLVARFQLEKNRLKAELIAMEFQNIKFREKDKKKYPSVTSITGWSKDFHISDIDLAQYGSRGQIAHAMIDVFIDKENWPTLAEIASNGYAEDATLMTQGSLGLLIEDCSFKKFFEVHGKDFEFVTSKKKDRIIFNDQYLYTGEYDVIAYYKGRKAIVDWKTGKAWDFKQLAAYANGDGIEDIELLIVCQIGPTDNKTGVMKPSITENISLEYERFLKDRSEFKKRFGI